MNIPTKILPLIILFFMGLQASAQSIQKTFKGSWARSNWTFEFYEDNTYIRSSTGDFGEIEQRGIYQMLGDTIKLITGSKQVNGLANSKYVLQDDQLIDLQISYDEAYVKPGINFYNSTLVEENAFTQDIVLEYSFENVKVYVKYKDLRNIFIDDDILTEDLINANFASDTIQAALLTTYYSQKEIVTVSYEINYKEQFFKLVDDKKAQIYLNGILVNDFYTNKITIKSGHRNHPRFKGIRYFDKTTKTTLFTKTIYRTFYTPPCPSF